MSGDITKIKTIPCWVFFGGVNYGYTDAPVEVSAEVVKKEVQADQTGDEILLSIVQGTNLRVVTTFKEHNKENLKSLYISGGLGTEFTDGVCSIDPETNTTEALCTAASGDWTPSTPVIGIGSATRGLNLATSAKELKLVPIDPAERENTLVAWKASPSPGGFTYSGTEESMIEVEFSIFSDSTKPAGADKAFIGDPDNMPNYYSEA